MISLMPAHPENFSLRAYIRALSMRRVRRKVEAILRREGDMTQYVLDRMPPGVETRPISPGTRIQDCVGCGEGCPVPYWAVRSNYPYKCAECFNLTWAIIKLLISPVAGVLNFSIWLVSGVLTLSSVLVSSLVIGVFILLRACWRALRSAITAPDADADRRGR